MAFLVMRTEMIKRLFGLFFVAIFACLYACQGLPPSICRLSIFLDLEQRIASYRIVKLASVPHPLRLGWNQFGSLGAF